MQLGFQLFARIDRDIKKVIPVEDPINALSGPPNTTKWPLCFKGLPDDTSVLEIFAIGAVRQDDGRPGNTTGEIPLWTFIFAADRKTYRELSDLGHRRLDQPDTFSWEQLHVATPHRSGYWVPDLRVKTTIILQYPHLKEQKLAEDKQMAVHEGLV